MFGSFFGRKSFEISSFFIADVSFMKAHRNKKALRGEPPWALMCKCPSGDN